MVVDHGMFAHGRYRGNGDLQVQGDLSRRDGTRATHRQAGSRDAVRQTGGRDQAAPAEQVQRKLGFMAGTLGIEGAIESDIVGPIGALDETQTLKKWDGLNNRPMSRHIAYSAASARAADRPSQRSNSRPAAVTATIAMPPATSRRT